MKVVRDTVRRPESRKQKVAESSTEVARTRKLGAVERLW